jgi:phosphohistidine phosphatase
MNVYFVRHGPSPSLEESGVARDSERPLSEGGEVLCRRLGEALRRVDVRLDLVAASPLKRARQTADAVAQGLGIREKVLVTDALSPGCTLMSLAEFARSHKNADRMMFVGHEPDMSEIVGELIGGGAVRMKPGALARVKADELAPGMGVLRLLVPAEMLILVGVVPDM